MFIVRFLILLAVVLPLHAESLPVCKGKVEASDLETDLFVNEVSREALRFSLNQYANELLVSAEIRDLMAPANCQTPAKRKALKGIVSLLINSELTDAGMNSDLGTCSKSLGEKIPVLIAEISERTTAFLCNESGRQNLQFSCQREKSTRDIVDLLDSRLENVADQLKVLDQHLAQDFVREKSLLRSVVCTKSGSCTQYGQKLSFKESERYREMFSRLEGPTRRREFLLNSYPMLGLVTNGGQRISPKATLLSAIDAPFTLGGLTLAASNGDGQSFQALKNNYSITRPRLYQTLNPQSLAWGKKTSRTLIASVAMSYVCGSDREDLAQELIRLKSPIISPAWNRFLFHNPGADNAYCSARARGQKNEFTRELQTAALYLSAAAAGIAATPFTGGTSLALVAASSGLGMGITTQGTWQKMKDADQARALYQMCEVGFKEMFRRETEELQQQSDALLSYSLDVAGIFLEGIKLGTYQFKKVPQILKDIEGDIVKEQAFLKFLRNAESKGVVVNDEFISDLNRIHITGKFQESGLDPAKGREMVLFLKKYPSIKREELLYLADKDIGVLGIRSKIAQLFSKKPKHVFVPKKRIDVVLKDIHVEEMYETSIDGLPLLKGRDPADDVLQRAIEIPKESERAAFITHVSNLRNHRPHPPGLRQAEWWWFEYFKNGRSTEAAGRALIPMEDLDGLERTYLKYAYELDLCNPVTDCYRYKDTAEKLFRRRDALIDKLESIQNKKYLSYKELFDIDREYLILDDNTLNKMNVTSGLDDPSFKRGLPGENTVKVIVNRELGQYEVAVPYSGINPSDLKRGMVRFDGSTANAKYYRHHDHAVHSDLMTVKMPKTFEGLVEGFGQWHKDWNNLKEILKDRPLIMQAFDDALFRLYHESDGNSIITLKFIRDDLLSRNYIDPEKFFERNELIKVLDDYLKARP